MPRLFRPHIPLEVRCRVALRQLGELWPDEALKVNEGGLGAFLDRLLFKFAETLDCSVDDLHLDHDPALATRQRKGEGKNTAYSPAANNPEFLIYREKHAHFIKTNVRGEGAQYPDRVLIKRERRRLKKAKPKKKLSKWRSRSSWPKGRKIPSRRKS